MIEQLRDTLSRVQMAAGQDFSGIGVIVCDSPEVLPIYPLRQISKLPEDDLVSCLTKISSLHSSFHDGFHIISSKWELMRVAQYFSPPIVADAEIDRTKQFGGRYLAALFGSALPGVELSGVASNGFGLAIFQGGKEIIYEQTV